MCSIIFLLQFFYGKYLYYVLFCKVTVTNVQSISMQHNCNITEFSYIMGQLPFDSYLVERYISLCSKNMEAGMRG